MTNEQIIVDEIQSLTSQLNAQMVKAREAGLEVKVVLDEINFNRFQTSRITVRVIKATILRKTH